MESAVGGALADTLFVHGHQLSRWVVDYVDLEESLTAGSLAQDDLAHAVTLWELAGFDCEARDQLVYARPAAQWTASAVATWPTTTFADVVARGLAIARYAVASLERDDSEAATTMAAEQRLHIEHWERWSDILNSDAMLSAAFDAAIAEAERRGSLVDHGEVAEILDELTQLRAVTETIGVFEAS
jgi:1,2-phenylacetyl-CoA epoxidase catalytic subunit